LSFILNNKIRIKDIIFVLVELIKENIKKVRNLKFLKMEVNK